MPIKLLLDVPLSLLGPECKRREGRAASFADSKHRVAGIHDPKTALWQSDWGPFGLRTQEVSGLYH